MKWNLFTLWASPKGEEPSPWMVAAEDENSWEADPDRCERVFQTARDLCERNSWDCREVTLTFDCDAVAARFAVGEVAAEVESAPRSGAQETEVVSLSMKGAKET